MQITSTQIKKILLIDDDADDCLVFKMALAEIDPSIRLYYENCGDTIDKIIHSIEPDLVFLDINLPRVNGLECLQRIKKSVTNNAVSVVMYSSSELPKDLSGAFEAGATLYFRKPSDITSLILTLQKILDLDWQNPHSIRSRYCREGKYQTV